MKGQLSEKLTRVKGRLSTLIQSPTLDSPNKR